jgi:hypothetical protein
MSRRHVFKIRLLAINVAMMALVDNPRSHQRHSRP